MYELHLISIDASAPDRVLRTSPYDKRASAVSTNGSQMLFSETSHGDRLMTASLDGSGVAKRVGDGTLEQRLGVMSPDGRSIAYSEHGDVRA